MKEVTVSFLIVANLGVKKSFFSYRFWRWQVIDIWMGIEKFMRMQW